ncbi:hypothetical protein [Halosolutus halophilus]|nr:hypothetical protein [Halosolutus halophilus]
MKVRPVGSIVFGYAGSVLESVGCVRINSCVQPAPLVVESDHGFVDRM